MVIGYRLLVNGYWLLRYEEITDSFDGFVCASDIR